MTLSSLVSKRPKMSFADILFSFIHVRKTSTTSSDTNTTPQAVQERGWWSNNSPQAPHSQRCSSPANRALHSGQTLESSGMMAWHAPHAAICVESSLMENPIRRLSRNDIIIHGAQHAIDRLGHERGRSAKTRIPSCHQGRIDTRIAGTCSCSEAPHHHASSRQVRGFHP